MNLNSDIKLENFQVKFITRGQEVKALRNTDLIIKKNKVTGIIGETGCGKSVLALGILGLLPKYAIVDGNIYYDSLNLKKINKKERAKYLGNIFGYIPQNPGESLNPIRKIKQQIKESLRLIYNQKNDIYNKSRELIGMFGFEDVERVLNSYPFQLSGGMQQRVLAAICIASDPDWIIADEPTKGLDKKVQKDTIKVFNKIRDQGIESMLIITHDITLVKDFCDELIVMYSGEVIEIGENIIKNPMHPYTVDFFMSLPENGMKPILGKALSPTEDIKGCRFFNRCKYVTERCKSEKPNLYNISGRKVRCFLYD